MKNGMNRIKIRRRTARRVHLPQLPPHLQVRSGQEKEAWTSKSNLQSCDVNQENPYHENNIKKYILYSVTYLNVYDYLKQACLEFKIIIIINYH